MNIGTIMRRLRRWQARKALTTPAYVLALALLLLPLASAPLSGAYAADPPTAREEAAALQAPGADNPHVPFLEEQFHNLAIHGDPLGARRGKAGDACACAHYQGIARGQDSRGVPYLYLSRSGNDSGFCVFKCTSFFGDKKPGELVAAELLSRDTDGERLRSNLLKEGEKMKDTEAPEGDEVVASYLFDGHDGWPKYMHPGGMQLVGDVLVVALDKHCAGTFTGWDPDGSDNNCTNDEGPRKGAIALIDVSEPRDARVLSVHVPDDNKGMNLAAATFVPEEDAYLFLWTDNDADYYFAWSDRNDLHEKELAMLPPCVWNKDNLGENKWMKFQALNFVWDTDGTLYLIGTDNNRGKMEEAFGGGEDWVRLFKVDLSKLNSIDIENAITYVAERHLRLNYEGLRMGDFDAAGGVYVSPSRQLMLYSAAHDNGGPDGALQMGEFRNTNITYNDWPPGRCGGWVELYDEDNGWVQYKEGDWGNRAIMFDYIDRDKEDWGDLDLYDDGFGDNASSVKWSLPEGQTAWLCKDEYCAGECMELPGEGRVLQKSNFSFEPGDWNDKIHSVCISPSPGETPEVCDGRDNDCNGLKDEGYGHDNDFDGWGAQCDNCPAAANAGQADEDWDGVGDVCDACPYDQDNDVDGDGVCADMDNCRGTANPGQEDADGDGAGDVCDNCPDMGNNQWDADGDGVGDVCDACPNDWDNDADGDGVCGDVDNCPNIPNPGQEDSDDEGLGDACDNCPNYWNRGQEDADGDGVGDVCDNCPNTGNPGQEDADGDGIGDACQACPDPDIDGVCGDADNCPNRPNPGQENADGDGIGDVCDACPNDPDNDADGDGWCGDVDNCPNHSDPSQWDGDNDGVGDVCDNCSGTENPYQEDADQDGAGDACDYCTDADGDGYEVGRGIMGRYACTGPGDCDDTNPSINPGAAESCTDGIDNDCDELVDDGDPDCPPPVSGTAVSVSGLGLPLWVVLVTLAVLAVIGVALLRRRRG